MNKEEPEVQPKAIGELGSSVAAENHLLIELWSLEREVEGYVNTYTSNTASAEYRCCYWSIVRAKWLSIGGCTMGVA